METGAMIDMFYTESHPTEMYSVEMGLSREHNVTLQMIPSFLFSCVLLRVNSCPHKLLE